MTEAVTVDTGQSAEAQIQAQRVQFGRSTGKLIMAAAGLALPLVVGLWLLHPDDVQFLILAGCVVLAFLSWAAYPVFLRLNRVEMGGYFSIFTFLLIVIIAPLIMPAILPAVVVGLMGVGIIGTMILGERAALWLIGASVLGLAADIVLLASGADAWFPPLDETISTLANLGITSIAFVFGGLITRNIVSGQTRYFRAAHNASLENVRRAAAEQQQREQLEAAQQEIEERIEREMQQREQSEALVNQLREAATQIASATAEILAATTQQIASATEQDTAVTQTMTTVEEIVTTVMQAAERAQGVAEASQQSVVVAQHGQQAVAETIEGMDIIRERVEDIAETILALSGRTQQIGEIINTVNEIAGQSKLLALNASIEAARAGEEGRGFAVVAMEVRQLAEQSREATARVADILNEIQQTTNKAVMVTEEGSKGAERGMGLVERAGEAIRDLTTMIEAAAQAAAQIAASTQQQNNGMEQLAAAMASIKQATTQTAVSTRQAERSAQDLADMAQAMETTVARYQM